MEKSHVGFAWNHAKFDAVTRNAVRSATSLALLASKTAFGYVRIETRANYHAQCPVICFLILSCGHQCSSVCGEICPEGQSCQQCVDELIKNMMIDYIMGFFYAKIDLDGIFYIISSCDHILTLENINGHMEMFEYYIIFSDTKAENPIIALKSSSVSFSISELKNCFLCQKLFHKINRYGRIVRRVWIDEATKEFIV